MSHYETLGVPRDATLDEIRHAYLAKAAQLRPERFAGAPANVVAAVEEAEGVIDEAWRVLGDEVLRADYDRELLEQDDSYRARAESVWAMERELGWPLSPVFGLEPPQVIPGSYRAAAPSAAEGPGALPARSGGVGLAGPVSVPSQRGDVFPLITSLETIANWLAPRGRTSKTVSVPDVRGLRASEAFYAVAQADLEINFVRLTENPTGGDGTVVDQDPAPGASVRRHSRLTVQVVHPKPDAGISLR